MDPPVTLVIGAVAGLELAWYENLPVFGRRVIVTRARESASELCRRLQELGARVVEVPTIRIEPPGDGGAGLDRAASALASGDYDWVVFTSARAVDALLSHVPDARRFSGVSIAAVGPATTDALSRYHLIPDVVPPAGRQDAAGIVDLMRAKGGSGRVLFPRAAEGRDTLVDGLTAQGLEVDLVEAYRTVPAEPARDAAAEVAGADAVCFTSSSTVTGFLTVFGLDAVPPVVVCIGPVTAETARAAGLKVSGSAAEASVAALADAVVSALRAPMP